LCFLWMVAEELLSLWVGTKSVMINRVRRKWMLCVVWGCVSDCTPWPDGMEFDLYV